jgi:hypothetical protein
MPIGQHLSHRCDIQEQVSTQNALGEVIASYYSTTSQEVRCRLMETGEQVLDSERVQLLAVTRYLLFFPAGTQIAKDSRVVNLRFEDGSEFAGQLRVESILSRRARHDHHITVEVKVVS